MGEEHGMHRSMVYVEVQVPVYELVLRLYVWEKDDLEHDFETAI